MGNITYESNIDKAKKIVEKVTINLKEKAKEGKFSPSIRLPIDPSCMTLKIRFYAPVEKINETSSDLIKEFYDLISKEKNVEIAYPHTEIIFKDKKLFKVKK